jgi:hypothetical protein
MNNAAISLSICLSDIPKDKIKKATNGKLYLQTDVRMKKDGKDQFGNDIYAIVSQTKEEREAQEPKVYIGSGQYREFTPQGAVRQEEIANAPAAGWDDVSDLPF